MSEKADSVPLAAECGADAVLVVTPFYYKNGMKDNILEQYFTEVADRSPLPVVRQIYLQ